MTGPVVLTRYAAVLRGQGTALPLLASVVGRLALAMNGLALLLLVRETTGSYAVGGLVSGAYALAFGALGPQRAKAADRTGPVRSLRLTGTLHPLIVVGFVLAALSEPPVWVLVLGAVLAGATVPPVGPVMRALWGTRLSGQQLATAYSLESVVVELCFVTGPLLTAVLVAVSGPASAVLTSGVLSLVGALLLSSTPALRAVRPHPAEHRGGSPLSSTAVRSLLAVMAVIGLGFGSTEVAMPVFAEAEGARPALAGALLAVWAFGSVVGGLVYGGLHLGAPPRRQLTVLVAALAVGTALPLLARSPWVMALTLVLYGVSIAPISACVSVLLSEAAPPGTVTEAFAWSSSMIFGGAAVGSVLGGALAETSGPTGPLTVTAASGVLALLAAAAARHRSRELSTA